MRNQLVANAGAVLLVLLVATTLSVYKPGGRTWHGRRKQGEQGVTGDRTTVLLGRGPTISTRWVYLCGIIVFVLVLVFVILHLTGGGLGSHTP